MLAFVPLASSLEKSLGSWQLLHLCLLVFPVLSGLLHCLLSSLGSLLTVSYFAHDLSSCTAGLSGVIFALIVIDVYSASSLSPGGEGHRRLFFFMVPAVLYPWALLLFIQLLAPGSSLLGHLSGMLVGYFYCWGWLASANLPHWLLDKFGSTVGLKKYTELGGFVPHGSPTLPLASAPQLPKTSR